MKSKGIQAVLLLATALALSFPAMAQKSQGAFYLGAAVGKSTSDSYCDSVGPPCKDQDQTWKILGGYQFNRYIAVEAAFQSLGVRNDTSIPRDDKGQDIELVGILSYPIFWDLAPYGKLGAYRGRVRGFDGTTGATFNHSNVDVTYGVGVQWNYFDPLGIRAELQRYPRLQGVSPTGVRQDQDVVVWSVGAIFRFK